MLRPIRLMTVLYDSYRNILSHNDFLTSSFFSLCKIADAALTEKKDTPQFLLKMWKDGYLHMQVFTVWKPNHYQK